ncbi:MAG: response regulator transcription factor [Myxococcales bacterium]
MSGATVFVVDDDEAVARSVAKIVRVLGYEGRTFRSAESFLAQYEGGEGCLLVDVRMPGMSGFDLVEELARRRVSLPVIIMSGHFDAAVMPRPETPLLGVLEKPFSIGALRQLLARWHASSSAPAGRST